MERLQSGREEENHGTYGKKTEYTERTHESSVARESMTIILRSFRIFRLLSVCSVVFFLGSISKNLESCPEFLEFGRSSHV